MGSDEAEFELNRFGASGNFIYFRGDLSAHARLCRTASRSSRKVQGQASDKPLVNSEQFSAGGLGTVRGYLESEELGDNGILGSVELRTPSLGDVLRARSVDDWRFYRLRRWRRPRPSTIRCPSSRHDSSWPASASAPASSWTTISTAPSTSACPLDNGPDTHAYAPLFTFRVWAEF